MPDQPGRHPIDLFVALVPNRQPALGVEHRKTARHVGQRRIETDVLPRDFLVEFAQRLLAAVEPDLVADRKGDADQDDHA